MMFLCELEVAKKLQNYYKKITTKQLELDVQN